MHKYAWNQTACYCNAAGLCSKIISNKAERAFCFSTQASRSNCFKAIGLTKHHKQMNFGSGTYIRPPFLRFQTNTHKDVGAQGKGSPIILPACLCFGSLAFHQIGKRAAFRTHTCIIHESLWWLIRPIHETHPSGGLKLVQTASCLFVRRGFICNEFRRKSP